FTFLVEFTARWLAQAERDRHEVLEDPWAFKSFVLAVPGRAAQTQREALLFIVHPESFEDITSGRAKQEIVAGFEDLVGETSEDVDRALLKIRSALGGEYGPGFRFYDAALREKWQRTAIKPLLQEILSGYSNARLTQPFGKQSQMWKLFASLRSILDKSDPVATRPSI